MNRPLAQPDPEHDRLLGRAIFWSLLLGAAWIVAAIVGWLLQPQAFFRAYLFTWLFYLGITLGSLAAVMLHHLTGGNWGWMIRRIGEHAAATMPLLAVLFVPILFGLHHLYPWDQPDMLASDAILRHRRPYLNPEMFILRAVVYFIIWCAAAWYLRSRSLRYDEHPNPAAEKRMHDVSAVMMLIYFITMSFAAVDWIMSREPHWYSTIFGWQVIAGQAVAGTCFCVVALALLARREPFRRLLIADHFNDLGTLLLTCVILWSYLTFVQLLVSWMGNKQDEIPWYTQRLNNGWFALGAILVVFHFFVPFITLLQRAAKRKRDIMLWLCAMLLVIRAIDNFWLVGPSGDDRTPYLHEMFNWMDVVFPIGMGGLWLAAVCWLGRGRRWMAEGYTMPSVPIEPESAPQSGNPSLEA